MKNGEKIKEGPAEYFSWALSILKEFYVVIDVDAADDSESDQERIRAYYIKSQERVV